ncbi:caspase-2 isoform X2 [Pseudochaenichthys georgianus]|uniref:caspase-2 isoform X2 n=1 Tax=Pseudochaenichthys georgianus TaxID=52239 RepID=UPI00146ACCF7|nr:caspase-2 isoform X1 [Pseudochaenichthys georgianus]
MLECGMQEQDRRALQRNTAVLCKQLVVDELLIQLLQADSILTESMAEGIMAEQTSHKRSFRLLLLLPKRGPRAFSGFCSALQETEQQHLYDLIRQSTEQYSKETSVKVIQPEEEPEGSAVRLVVSEKKKEVRSVDSSLPLPTQEESNAKRARTQESMELSLDADSPIKTPVLPCSHDFYLSHFQQSYRVSSSPRGLALVISNVTFDPCAAPDLDTRKGGEVDDDVLRKVFTELDYKVTVHRDLTAQDMRTCIESFTRRPDHHSGDSSVVCLLSHGVEGAIYGTDGQLLQLDWVFESFDNAHCPLLQNKPKMFFIQACRGEEMDCGVEQIDGPMRTCSPSCEQRDAGREVDASSRQRGGLGRIKLPQRSDMICGYASLKGQSICTAAMRNTKRGSWFIQELNSSLRLNARDTHLADILVQVNGRIKEREGYAPGTRHHRCKEMSEFTSSLCKNLYFFPKYHPQY